MEATQSPADLSAPSRSQDIPPFTPVVNTHLLANLTYESGGSDPYSADDAVLESPSAAGSDASSPSSPRSPLIDNQAADIPPFTSQTSPLQRLKYYIPILSWLPRYPWSKYLKNDIRAAVAVSCILIPQCLSYASTLARVDPLDGLYTAAIPCLIYAFLGTSRQLSMGPEALIAIMIGSEIRRHPEIDPAVLVCTLTFLAGTMTFLLGFLRFGFVDSVISRAMLRGFVNAVAIAIVIEQFPHLFGLQQHEVPDPESSPFVHFWHTLLLLKTTVREEATIAFASVAFLKSASWAKKMRLGKFFNVVPEVFILVVVTSGLTWWFGWEVDRLGPWSDRTSHFTIPFQSMALGDAKGLMLPAALITVVGIVESLAGAKLYAMKNSYTISRNRDLVAFGVANMTAALTHGFAGFASLARTKIFDDFGAKSQLSGLITGLIVMIVLVVKPTGLSYLPTSTMAAIVSVAASGLFEFKEISFLLRLGAWKELLFMFIIFCTTLFVSIQAGIVCALLFSLLFVLKRTTTPRLSLLGHVHGTGDQFSAITEFPLHTQTLPGVMIVRVEESLHFANASELRNRLGRLERFGDLKVHPSSDAWLQNPMLVVLDMERMCRLDGIGTQSLLEIAIEYRARGITLRFVSPRPSVSIKLQRSGILSFVGGSTYESVASALIQAGFGAHLNRV